jgi:hypothetical protein
MRKERLTKGTRKSTSEDYFVGECKQCDEETRCRVVQDETGAWEDEEKPFAVCCACGDEVEIPINVIE